MSVFHVNTCTAKNRPHKNLSSARDIIVINLFRLMNYLTWGQLKSGNSHGLFIQQSFRTKTVIAWQWFQWNVFVNTFTMWCVNVTPLPLGTVSLLECGYSSQIAFNFPSFQAFDNVLQSSISEHNGVLFYMLWMIYIVECWKLPLIPNAQRTHPMPLRTFM